MLFELPCKIALGCVVEDIRHLAAAFSLAKQRLCLLDPDILNVFADGNSHMLAKELGNVLL